MTRRKRLLSLLLSVLMLCTLLPPRASAAPTLYFTAVNDRMCDLSDETMPFWQNGLLYVAGATVDGPDDLGIRYSYNQEKSVAILYKGQRVLYCDLTAGTMENNRTGEQYAGSPIVRSGMVFFPITALAKMFDLKYSSTKIAYGYLLRIRDDNAVLSDEYFIDAATDPIQKRYAQYERAHAAAEQENETPAQVETPVRRDDLTVYLLLPAANGSMLTQFLSTLENHQSHATLLLTPELLESAGDGVRRAAATGNAVALRVQVKAARRLRGVENEQKAVPARKSADAGCVQRVAGEIGGVRADDRAGVRPQRAGEIGIIDAAARIGAQERDLHALLFQPVERAEHAVVLEIGRNHVVAGPEKPENGGVERLGRVLREAHARRVRPAEKGAELFARGVYHARGGKRAFARAAADVAQ